MSENLTITISGEQGSGKTLLAKAISRLLTNRGFVIVETATGNEGFEALTLDVNEEDREALLAYGVDLPKAPTLDLNTPDRFGNRPQLDLIGRLFRHTGNGKVYRIAGFAWMGEDDVWGFRHLEVGNLAPIVLVRPLSHISGLREDGTQRYEEVLR